jgi:hypothetical protein
VFTQLGHIQFISVQSKTKEKQGTKEK